MAKHDGKSKKKSRIEPLDYVNMDAPGEDRNSMKTAESNPEKEAISWLYLKNVEEGNQEGNEDKGEDEIGSQIADDDTEVSIAALKAVGIIDKKRKREEREKKKSKKSNKKKRHSKKADDQDAHSNVDPALSGLEMALDVTDNVTKNYNTFSGNEISDEISHQFSKSNGKVGISLSENGTNTFSYADGINTTNNDQSIKDTEKNYNDISNKNKEKIANRSVPSTIKGAGELDDAFLEKGIIDSKVLKPLTDKLDSSDGILSSSLQSAGRGFDAEEDAKLDAYINEYQKMNSFTREQLCDRIWNNNGQRDDFWKTICKILPYRTRSSLYKHVRRRYHIFEQRGKWTREEDEILAKLCLEKEGQWSVIGKEMGRMPEDVRDRWRNYIKCGEKRASQKWTAEEETKLKEVIGTMFKEAAEYHQKRETEMDGIHDGIIDAEDKNNHLLTRGPKGRVLNDKPGFNEVINWTVVSERMGGTRSRIQCRYKWNKMIKDEALSKVKNVTDEEGRWLLKTLQNHNYTHQSHIDWNSIATEQPESNKWSPLELRLCYEKLREPIDNIKNKTVTAICTELLSKE
ncbi:DNA-binding protein REB1 [Nakaseomyces glabratus]|nr:Myb-like domain profile [Nakaseomyces glabratus]KAH7596436.1 Myb-like domain profile [Nakaseomyces glabratus]KAH7612003.1 Myb-like domain profile [Nakaseomyces glabratus]KTB02182.1 DNA-binding protein REB1 [Nakaseomyces glabratus]KTB04799.1 DNA-binding protein REB1 [Nakaseomyces glabratus]